MIGATAAAGRSGGGCKTTESADEAAVTCCAHSDNFGGDRVKWASSVSTKHPINYRTNIYQ